MYNVLVTGAGGDIGQSVGKILKSTSLFDSIIGCDIHEEHAGKFIYDKVFKISKCSSDLYLYELVNIVNEMGIDIIIPVSESELRFLTQKGIDSWFLNKVLISSNLKAREIGFDKLRTIHFLKEENLPYPETEILSDIDKPKFPLVVKSRIGSGSKSIYKVNDFEKFNYLKNRIPDYLAQEYIGSSAGEFTCGLYRSTQKDIIRSIIFERKLINGYTGFGKVIHDSRIIELLHSIAFGLDLRGSINIQLRFSGNDPLIFEINPRFSSTVLFRHMLGFKDLVWSLEDALNMPISDYIQPVIGSKFYKGYMEFVQ